MFGRKAGRREGLVATLNMQQCARGDRAAETLRWQSAHARWLLTTAAGFSPGSGCSWVPSRFSLLLIRASRESGVNEAEVGES